MKFRIVRNVRTVLIAFGLLGCLGGSAAFSQADATATRGLEISVFGGATAVFTGLAGGHNGSFTGGVDVGFRPFFGLLPAVEVRGLYPVKSGSVDQQKNVVAGLRLEKRRGAFRLYGDALFGRGRIDYESGGFLDASGTYNYVSSTSDVFSPGAGVSYDLTPRFSFFADAQFQRYASPVTASGHLWSKPVTLGLSYRFPAQRHGRPY